ELTEQIDPITAGLSFAVAIDKDFTGRDAIAAMIEKGPERMRVGLQLGGKRIAREGTPLMSGDEQIGIITSGTFSPTLERSIAMGYVDRRFSDVGSTLDVDLRG